MVTVAVMVALSACGGGSGGHDAPGSSPTPPAASVNPPGSGTGGPGASGSALPRDAGAAAFPYQPLWPFGNTAEAARWRDQSAPAGADAWHGDAPQTANRFARTFLGFGEVTQTIGSTVSGDDARVTVGIRTETGQSNPAAVVHLVRYGGGANAPWEVVGTDDTTLSLTAPGYGSVVGPTIIVGGRISGVDESIRVQARLVGGPVVGEYCCLPAGGEKTPWTAKLTLRGVPAGQRVVLVASTGGHVTSVERFAVTGVTVQG